MLLPAIQNKIVLRPGESFGVFEKCFVANPDEQEFLESFSSKFKNVFQYPVSDRFLIDPFFGYFGERFHPVILKPKYFHIGIDIMAKAGVKVYPITDGFLEYSGFSRLNGNYVMLSHPEIRTQDGFTLYSLYLHLEKFYFRFNLFQKIVREVGLRKLVSIPTEKTKAIGEVGATGNIKGLVPHIHLQLEFRDEKRNVVAVDPVLMFGFYSKKNLTALISSSAEFQRFAADNASKLNPWSKLWDFKH